MIEKDRFGNFLSPGTPVVYHETDSSIRIGEVKKYTKSSIIIEGELGRRIISRDYIHLKVIELKNKDDYSRSKISQR